MDVFDDNPEPGLRPWSRHQLDDIDGGLAAGQMWGAPVTLPRLGANGVVVMVSFNKPTTVALDFTLPDPRTTPLRVSWRVSIGVGRSMRVKDSTELPRLVTGQTITVEVFRVDNGTDAPTVQAWATPMENARPELTLLAVTPAAAVIPAFSVFGFVVNIPLIDQPDDATHAAIAVAEVINNTSATLGIASTLRSGQLVTQWSKFGVAVGLGRTVPLIREATRLDIITTGTNAGDFLPFMLWFR